MWVSYRDGTGHDWFRSAEPLIQCNEAAAVPGH